jgi:PPK2 family polyphosphate:nucleotide phosphotransferase
MKHSYRFDDRRDVDLDQLETKPVEKIEREAAEMQTREWGAELEELQELLYGAGTHGVLIVLQGRDTAGKDGAIRCLAEHLNVQGTHVKGFKAPTPEELDHDFLWRVHPHVPGRGTVSIFNRSHYEDVLVVRVHDLAPEHVWRKRFKQIENFEQLLAENHTIVVKAMLHISKEEQEERLLDREKDVAKAWKLSAGDWQERELWDAYTAAYNEAISKTSTPSAPWFVIPADKKWYRDLALLEILVETLRPYRKAWISKLEAIGAAAKAELAAYRKSKDA